MSSTSIQILGAGHSHHWRNALHFVVTSVAVYVALAFLLIMVNRLIRGVGRRLTTPNQKTS